MTNKASDPLWQVTAVVVIAILAILVLMCTPVQGSGMDEVNEWRRRVGLPTFIEDPAMTRFAEYKARFRAERGLKDGHAGPRPSDPSWREGTGEAEAWFGWLTCVMEESATHAGAGMCVGHDGERYMVLYVRGGTGQALIPRHNIPTHRTSYLTPNPPSVHDRAEVKPETAPKRARVLISTGLPIPNIDAPIPFRVAPKASAVPVHTAGTAARGRLTYPPSTPNTVVMFSLPGCSPCQQFKVRDKPKLEADGVKVVIVYEVPPGLTVTSFPSFMVSGDPKIYPKYQTAARLRQRLSEARARRG